MKGKARRLLSWVCVLALCMSLLPVTALATTGSGTQENPVTNTKNQVTVNKWVTGTGTEDNPYTLTMEAWAQNKVTSSTTATPLDIVLVLDMSGSMDDPMGVVTEYTSTGSRDWSYRDIRSATTYYYKAEDGNYYRVRVANFGDRQNPEYALTYGTSEWDAEQIPKSKTSEDRDATLWTGELYRVSSYHDSTTRIDALKSSVGTFIDSVAGSATSNNVDHRISIVKFAGNKTNEIGNDTYDSGRYEYNYSQIVKGLTSVSGAGASQLKAAVNSLDPMGATQANYGMDLAKTALDRASQESKKVVVMFTDGEPTSGSDFEGRVANGAISTAHSLKQSGVTVYTIGVFSGADPDDISGRANAYMNGVSSNYPNANSYTDLGQREQGNYYFAASNSQGLNEVFEDIVEEVTTETLTVYPDTEAVLSDTLSQYFNFPDELNGNSGDITVQYVPAESIKDGKIIWENPAGNLPGEGNVSVQISDNKTITIQGFDYRTNAVTQNGDTVTGGKLVVSFPIELDAAECLTHPREGGLYPTNNTTDSKAGLAYKSSDKVTTNDEATRLDQSPTVKVDNEDISANGTDVTVQVYVDGTPVTNPYNYVDLQRNTEDTTYNYWNEKLDTSTGIISCDFNYNPNDGHDCVDIDVALTEGASKYVLQGITYHQSVGSGNPKDVTSSGNSYTVDNVTGVYTEEEIDSDVDVKIYLRTAYTVTYNGENAPADNNTYILQKDVADDASDNVPTVGANSTRNWSDSTLLTEISMEQVPTAAEGSINSGWYTDSDCTGTEYNQENNPNGVPVKNVSSTANEDNVINFYYESTAEMYTVTWKDEDGTELEKDENVEYGTMPSYDGEIPTKAADAQYTYEFAGWTPAVSKVTGDATYTATYTPTTRAYTVTWVDEDGTELEKDENVAYGTMPSYDGEIPTKAADAQYTYEFAGWTPAVSKVTGDATYTATYTPTTRAYTVTWVDEDGTELERTKMLRMVQCPVMMEKFQRKLQMLNIRMSLQAGRLLFLR